MRYKSDFKKLIEELDEYHWFFEIYAKAKDFLSPDTILLIIDDEEEDERDEFDEPIYPASKGFKRLMSIADLRSVMENMEEVCDNITMVKTIEAVLHYYNNDSFMY